MPGMPGREWAAQGRARGSRLGTEGGRGRGPRREGGGGAHAGREGTGPTEVLTLLCPRRDIATAPSSPCPR